MEGLGVLGVAGVGVDAVEAGVVGVVVAGSEVVVLEVGVELFAGVEEVGGGRGGGVAA